MMGDLWRETLLSLLTRAQDLRHDDLDFAVARGKAMRFAMGRGGNLSPWLAEPLLMPRRWIISSMVKGRGDRKSRA